MERRAHGDVGVRRVEAGDRGRARVVVVGEAACSGGILAAPAAGQPARRAEGEREVDLVRVLGVGIRLRLGLGLGLELGVGLGLQGQG